MNPVAALKRIVKPNYVRWFRSYDGEDLRAALARLEVRSGDTLMVHASWLSHNGYQGSPAAFIAVLKSVVGPAGLLVMTSMPYHNESSAAYLARGLPMDVRRTPSRMGLLTEVFRRDPEVRRSLSPTHPLLAWGHDAQAFVEGHDRGLSPFGPDSPFARLLARDGKILLVDAPFSTITFTHFLEDRIRHTLAMPFYEADPRRATVIDHEGQSRVVETLVIAAGAHAARREERLVAALEVVGAIRRAHMGNTRLQVLTARSMTAVVDDMVNSGASFFADGQQSVNTSVGRRP